jgi:hypothetical protein
MSLMLSQLIRCNGNLVDLWGVSTKNCRVDFTINDNKKDDGENDGGVDDLFDNNKELVAVSIEAAEPTEVVWGQGGAFLWRLNKNSINKTSTDYVSRQHRL